MKRQRTFTALGFGMILVCATAAHATSPMRVTFGKDGTLTCHVKFHEQSPRYSAVEMTFSQNVKADDSYVSIPLHTLTGWANYNGTSGMPTLLTMEHQGFEISPVAGQGFHLWATVRSDALIHASTAATSDAGKASVNVSVYNATSDVTAGLDADCTLVQP